MNSRLTLIFVALTCGALLSGCGASGDPDPDTPPANAPHDGSLRVVALDLHGSDPNDPAIMAAYVRGEILALQPRLYWLDPGTAGALDRMRDEHPGLRILAYFGPKIVRTDGAGGPREGGNYMNDIFYAGEPFLSMTTEGDTLFDFPGAAVVDFTQPACRAAMLNVFAKHQGTFGNRFDGIFWDYFNESLWISPNVRGVEGEPDMDGDGIVHWDDPDELEAFLAAQISWVHEVRARFGEGFLQVANGTRAPRDPDFAALFDGLYQELFPLSTYGWRDGFTRALDPSNPDNLQALLGRLRTRNGGPWLIPTNLSNVGSYSDQEGNFKRVVPGDIIRAVALLTDISSVHLDMTGRHTSGLPRVELALGAALEPMQGTAGVYTRAFEHGSIRVRVETGEWPIPLRFWIRDETGANLQVFDPPYVYP